MNIERIALGIWKISNGEGPTVALIGGTHGDELVGILIIQRLLRAFQDGEKEFRGTVYLVLGNLDAIEAGVRYCTVDLNRQFSDVRLSMGQKQCTDEVQRAQLIARRVLSEVSIVLDLHGTQYPSRQFVMTMNDPTPWCRALVQTLGCTAVITDPVSMYTAGVPTSIDEYVSRHGGIGLCYETGQAIDTTRFTQVYQEVLAFLDLVEMGEEQGSSVHGLEPPWYRMTKPIIPESLDFEWDSALAIESLEQIQNGQVIGSCRGQQVVSSFDGFLLFPKMKALWGPGMPVGFLVVLM